MRGRKMSAKLSRTQLLSYILILCLMAMNFSVLQIVKANGFNGMSWEKYADANGAIPVLDVGKSGDLDHPWVLSPTIIRDNDVLLDNDTTNDDELYKMWYNGNTIRHYYSFRIFYATSPNGIHWNKYVDKNGSAIPVIDLGSAPGHADDASAYSSCVINEGGTYKMWYSGQRYSTSSFKTLYATSIDGISWTKYGVVLDVGAPGERDERDAYTPQVIIDSDAPPSEKYKMWYTGQTQSGPLKIFYATSPDGINWTKYADANGAIPVVEPGGAPGGLDDISVAHQCVIKDNGGLYRMWHHGVNSTGQRILYANSSDGINWNKLGLAIDLGNPGELDYASVGTPSVLTDLNGTYEMWYMGSDGSYVRIFYAYPASPENLPPVADAGPDQTIYVGDIVQFNGSNSYDLDGTITTYKWDFDASDGLCWETGLPTDAIGPTPMHINSVNGLFIVTLNVTDNNGSADTDTCQISVLVPPPVPPTLYINISKDGKDVILYWDPPSTFGIDHYLIYRSTSQTNFDFNTAWKNTSIDKEASESAPIPLRTMWNDTNAAFPNNTTNYREQYYYVIRAVNILGENSRTSRTVGKWTKTFQKGVSTFSLPLQPLQNLTIDQCLSRMNAGYIRWVHQGLHKWMKHGEGRVNDTQMKVGEGYEVKFASQTNYTFTGMPAAMISYDDDSGLLGFDQAPEAKNLTVTVEPNGDVNLTWPEPSSMNDGWYEVYFSNKRDGFFGTFNMSYFTVCPPVNFGKNITTHVDALANQSGARLYYMVVPFNASGVRGASTYSIGIWTEGYLAQYDTFGIPLKLSNNYSADLFCDNISNTVGMNYYIHIEQRWCWHSKRMPSGAYDPILIMTEGYQISTSSSTTFTFIGV